MITKATVFILGAGVSMPYGFPSGSQLVQEIIGSTAGIHFEDNEPGLLNKGEITQILHTVFGEAHTEEFGKALHYSQRYSIDAFLERRPEYTEIGKWAIALFILRKEIFSNLFSFENQDKGCYRYLFDKLDTDWSSLADNRVSFITFNYDRSLEQFLFTAFQKTYGKNDNECAELLKQIPIIHMHGSLGKLPWQIKDGLFYGASIESYAAKSSVANAAANYASKQINIIPEGQTSSDEIGLALRLLSSAVRIYFLGFSYHATNLGRLRILDLFHNNTAAGPSYNGPLNQIMGTAMNLEGSERNVVINKWHIDLPDSNIDSLIFLRRYAQLD